MMSQTLPFWKCEIFPKTASDSASAKILVLEDDLSLQTVLTRVISRVEPGAKLTWVTTARDACDELDAVLLRGERPYDLILADICLPGSELGTKVWRHERKRYSTTEFAFMSGVDPDEYLRLFPRNEIAPPLLHKPFSVENCKNLLEFLLIGTTSEPGGD